MVIIAKRFLILLCSLGCYILFQNCFVSLASITIDIIVTFMFHIFFQFSSKVNVLISLFRFFQFYSVVSRDSKVDNFVDFLFFFC